MWRVHTVDGAAASTTHAPSIVWIVMLKFLLKAAGLFGKLGFQFNPKFKDDKAACMIVNDDASVMLRSEPFFKTFTKREICDTRSRTEGLFALSSASRAEGNDPANSFVPATVFLASSMPVFLSQVRNDLRTRVTPGEGRRLSSSLDGQAKDRRDL
jgi:uncharacterized protein